MNWSSAPIPVPDKPLLNLAEVEAFLGYNAKTIKRWVREGKFPAPKRIGDGQRWTALSIGVWLAWRDHCPQMTPKDGDSGEPVKEN